MKHKIPCFCEETFEVEASEEINLDSEPDYLDEILKGGFFNFKCPGCGKKHKPEFPLSVLWPSKNFCFEVLPELERETFYRRKKKPALKKPYKLETLIGYPEMAERLAIIRDGYEGAAVEAIKYYLHLKVEEEYPEKEIEIWYYGTCNPDESEKTGENDPGRTESSRERLALEFHIHGMKESEVAVLKIPLSLYQKTYNDYKKRPKGEIYGALRVHSYLSVKNIMRKKD